MQKRNKCAVLLCIVQVIILTLLLNLDTTSYSTTTTTTTDPNIPGAPPPYRQSLLRRHPRTGRDVRVMVFVVASKMTMAACVNVGSGYLSGIPVFVAGYDPTAEYNHIHKVQGTLEAAREMGLTTEDVVFFVDSDTVFTGPEQLLAVVDGFIAESAASASELDARAVREGRVRAPMIVSRENLCYSPESLGPAGVCVEIFNRTNEDYNEYARSKGIKQYVKQFSYINSGTFIARLWALEEFTGAFYSYMRQNPIPKRGSRWHSDQSIFNALYLDLRSWEARQDVLSLGPQQALSLRSQYGLRAGLLEVDERRELANRWLEDCIISNEFWLEDPNTEVALTESPFAVNYDAFTAKIYNQYKQPLHRYPLPPTDRNISPSSSVHHFFGHAVPPTEVADHGGNVLLATVPRRVAPAILHAVGSGLMYLRVALRNITLKTPNDKETLSTVKDKFVRMASKVPHLSWYIPLKYNATRMADAKAYLSELRIPLISEGSDTTGSYKEMCIGAFATSTAVHPDLYSAAADTYNLFFDYYQ